jgi:hypothetical protein
MAKYLKPGEGKPARSIKVVSGQSAWNRSVRNTSAAMVEHLGGDVTEPEKMLIRRIAVFESELKLMELAIARQRFEGVEPDERYIDLYSRITNSQRRLLESVGMKRVPKDVTPSISEYIRASAKPAGSLNLEEATDVTLDQTPASELP